MSKEKAKTLLRQVMTDEEPDIYLACQPSLQRLHVKLDEKPAVRKLLLVYDLHSYAKNAGVC
jgi:hypothetical protein